jgi:hypothetical protein
MPTLSEIAAKVKSILAKKANIGVSDIVDTAKLRDWPLSLDDTALGFVALDLRDYVKDNNSAATVTEADVRKDGLTVSALITLINKKIQGI